jgi:hypothetical protein
MRDFLEIKAIAGSVAGTIILPRLHVVQPFPLDGSFSRSTKINFGSRNNLVFRQAVNI